MNSVDPSPRLEQAKWAKRITAQRKGDNLLIRGESPQWPILTSDEAKNDPARGLRQYWRLARKNREMDKRLPVFLFANANSDQKLEEFAREFGPIDFEHIADESVTKDGARVLEVIESLDSLRREQRIFAALGRTISVLVRRSRGSYPTIAEDVATIVHGWNPLPEETNPRVRGVLLLTLAAFLGETDAGKLTRLSREELLEHARLVRGKRPKEQQPDNGPMGLFELGHRVVCLILDCFPPRLFAVSGPHGWVTSQIPIPSLRGIRPFLYANLRRYYWPALEQIGICPECKDLFRVTRKGQAFCATPDRVCSRRFRQRKYARERGNPLRRQRRKAKRAARR